MQNEYMSVLRTKCMSQLIQEPTRVTDKCSTLLDHIIVSKNEKITQSGTIPVGFSDHNLIHCTRKSVREQILSENVINIRSLKNYSEEILINSMEPADWESCSYVMYRY